MLVARSIVAMQCCFTFTRNMSKSLPIILMQDVWNLGKKGEIVTVQTGYMRNCLYPGKLAIYDVADNRKKLGIDSAVAPHHPVKGEPTAEEMERRRPKGYKLTLDKLEKDDDEGNLSDMSKLNMTIVNNKLSITKPSEDDMKKLKKMMRSDKLKLKNHGDTVEIK